MVTAEHLITKDKVVAPGSACRRRALAGVRCGPFRLAMVRDSLVTVFANGIWKSGNHLLTKVCGLLGVPKAEFGIATHLLIGDNYVVRRLIRGPRWEKSPIGVGIDMPVAVGSRWLNRKLRRLKGRCIGGHAGFSDRLLALLKENTIRPIQIVRDPRDVVTSFALWIETRPDYYAYPAFAGLSIPDRVLAVIQGCRSNSLCFESFATVMDRSYGWLTRPKDVLVVRFEDLVGPEGKGSAEAQMAALRQVADWLGLREVDLERVASEAFGGTPTFREGAIGSWREHFTNDVRAVFDDVVGPRLEQWGYSKK